MAVIVPIDADISGLTRKIRGAEMSLGSLAKVGLIAAGAAGVGALVATMRVGVDEFVQAEKVSAQTAAVLKSTGGAAHVTAKQIDELATSIMNKSGMDDEAVKSAENLLLTFTKIRNETGKGNDVFSQATRITADLSVAFHKDLNSSAILVGKALNDPIKGLSALSRVGIQFSEDQKKTIKALVESGDVMKAQKIILHELETQVGGSAAAYGRTLPGQLAIARETFRNMASDLVSIFMPTLANAATSVASFVRDLSARDGFQARLSFVFESAGSLIQRFYRWWTQPQLKTIRSPTSGVRVEFIPPGNEQVIRFVESVDAKLNVQLRGLGRRLGRNLAASIFGGATDVNISTRRVAQILNGLLNPTYIAQWAGEKGAELMRGVLEGIEGYIKSHPLEVGQKILDWVSNIPGLGDVGSKIASAISGGVRQGKRLLDPESTARILTSDVRAAINMARGNLAGLGASLGGMLSEATQAKLTGPGFGTQAQLDAKGRGLQDRQFALTESQLRANLAAQTKGSAEYAQAQLDLDQFLYEKESTLRQRAVDDANKANQKKIDDLVASFNAGKMSAKTFAAELDKIVGKDTGTGMGVAFAKAFSLAYKTIKNAALDITNIAGLSGLGILPDIGMPGGFNEGPVTASARAAYREAISRWQERVSRQRDKIKTLKDSDASSAAIAKANDTLKSIIGSKPAKSDYGLALGGILTGRRVVAGEAGAEAVIPLSSDRAAVMMRKAFGDAVGDTNYYVTINAGVGTDPNELGRVVVKAIKTYERRNGPVFASA